MSRLGLKSIPVPSGVEVMLAPDMVTIKGPKGQLVQKIDPAFVEVVLEAGAIKVLRKNDEIESKARHGLYWKLIVNMVEGVTNGFQKSLEIRGVGYRANLQGKKLEMSLGYSHPIRFMIPETINAEFQKDNNSILHISGVDRQLVGQVASNIRSFREPEPYKGKGIRYVGEFVPMKAGKSAAKGK